MSGIVAAALLAAPISASAADPIAAYRWKNRLLVVIAPTETDPPFVEQRRICRSAASGNRDRDLVVIEGIGQSAQADTIRARFSVPPGQFRAILVGKDGGAKLTSGEPIAAERLFAEIDAMPMRRDEMRAKP